MAIIIQFAIGLLLGTGLVVAGMSDPAKVLNFLDVAAIPSGGWDASLAFVMAGAVAVAFFGFRYVLRRERPVFAQRFFLPATRDIDARIVIGPAIFGVGWGLAGLCPGPALTAIVTGGAPAWLFAAAMFAGMAIARRLADRDTATIPATGRP